MIRRDLAEVLAIENSVFEFPWFEEDFIRCLRFRNSIGMVAEYGDRVVGFKIYELHRTRIHLLNFAVHADFQGMGVGTALMAKLQGKLGEGRRVRITTEVRERNLGAQLFLKRHGFEWINTLPGHYVDSDEDAYVLCHRHESVTGVKV